MNNSIGLRCLYKRMTTGAAQVNGALTAGRIKRPIVISGPSGCGKSTILSKLFNKHPNTFGFSVSHTSRAPRKGEIPDVSYHFVSREEFLKLKAEDGFIETAEFSGNLYGTSKRAVEEVAEKGKICVLDVELNGVKAIRSTDLGAIFILIRPPSFEILEKRLRGRNTDSEEAILKRLATAKRDLSETENSKIPLFDFVLTNADLEEAFNNLEQFIESCYSSDDLFLQCQ